MRNLVLQALQVMRQQGKRLLFVTNNSSKSRAQYVKKFESLGMQVDSSEVSSSVPGCSRYSGNSSTAGVAHQPAALLMRLDQTR
jgi:ribonucleotide monophosphatase NagD (HAD superfamily)